MEYGLALVDEAASFLRAAQSSQQAQSKHPDAARNVVLSTFETPDAKRLIGANTGAKLNAALCIIAMSALACAVNRATDAGARFQTLKQAVRCIDPARGRPIYDHVFVDALAWFCQHRDAIDLFKPKNPLSGMCEETTAELAAERCLEEAMRLLPNHFDVVDFNWPISQPIPMAPQLGNDQFQQYLRTCGTPVSAHIQILRDLIDRVEAEDYLHDRLIEETTADLARSLDLFEVAQQVSRPGPYDFEAALWQDPQRLQSALFDDGRLPDSIRKAEAMIRKDIATFEMGRYPEPAEII